MRSDTLKILARKEITKIPQRDPIESYINTLLGQRSLTPVTNYALPKFTGFDDSLDFFCLPDYLILCDNLCETDRVEKGFSEIYTVGSTSRTKTYLELNIRLKSFEVKSKAN